jgi:hypothetical protein
MSSPWLKTLFRFGGSASVPVNDSATATVVSDDDAEARLIVLTGALTASRTAVVPHRAGADWCFINATTGGYAVTVQGPTGAGISVPNGAAVYGVSDGTKLVNAVALVGAGVVTDANVAVGANIDGLKISPNFGSQNIVNEGMILNSGASSGVMNSGGFGLVVQATSGAGSAKSTGVLMAGECSTTDATPTILKSIEVGNSAICHVEAQVVALRDDGSAHLSQKVVQAFRWDAAGTGTYIGTNTVSDTRSNGTVSGMAVALVTNGARTLGVQVTGRNAETWRWGARVTLHWRTTVA